MFHHKSEVQIIQANKPYKYLSIKKLLSYNLSK